MSSQVLWNKPWSESSESTLRQALASQRCSIHELSSQQWDSKTASIGGVRDINTSYVAPASDSWSSLLLHLNSMIAEPLVGELSRLTARPAIVLLEYDQDAWGYSLFDGGALVDRFWSVPEAVDMPAQECTGNFEIVSSVLGVAPESIAPYIRHIADGERQFKAFEDDEYVLGDHWVRVDFLRRLGLNYPSLTSTAGGRRIRIHEPR